MKETLVLGIVILVAVASVIQFIQISAMSAQLTGNVIAPDTQGGETYEQMMARMHPDQVQAAAAAPQTAGPAMVGGC